MSRPRGPWRRYVALGDSFTEGLSDVRPDGPADPPGPTAAGTGTGAAEPVYRGWADRLAELVDAAQEPAGAPPLEYANLAVRGRLQRQILDEQLPAALALAPDLVSLSAGGNDLLRPGADVRAIAARTDEAVAALRGAGADVLLVAGVDPRAAPLLRLTRAKVADHNQRTWAVAQRHGALVLDLWGFDPLYDPRMWAEDRLHLSSEGHARVAELAAATLLGTPGTGDRPPWDVPLEPQRRPRVRGAREDAAWLRRHVAPWAARRVTGRSSGDGRAAKLPVPAAVVRRP